MNKPRKKGGSSSAKKGREAILEYMLKNVGKPIHTHKLKKVSGNQSEYGRRIRELRNEKGYDIITSNDDMKIPKDHYVLKSAKSNLGGYQFERSISTKTRLLVLERNGFSCQTCGHGASDTYPGTNKKVKLQIGHIKSKSEGGEDIMENLFAQCVKCNHGASDITPTMPSARNILRQIRKTSRKTQKEILKWLLDKYGDEVS